MAPTLDASTPALVTSASGNSWTTASFSPPAGSVLVVIGWGHHGGSTATASISNNGAAISWTLVRQQNVEEGVVAAWVAVLPAARTGLTVTVTSANAFQGGGVKAYVINGADLSTPVGAAVWGTSTAASFTTSPLSPQTGDALIFLGASNDQSSSTSVPTASGFTTAAAMTVGNQGVLAGHAAGPPAGGAITSTLAVTGASTRNWNWLMFEVRSAVTVVTTPSIPSAEQVGTPTITAGTASLGPASIPSEEVVGQPRLTPVIAPTPIPSAEQVGFPLFAPGTATVVVASIPSAEQVGTPTVAPGQIQVRPPSIPSAEQVGVPRLEGRVYPASIASAELVGVPTIAAGTVYLYPASIPSAEIVGSPTLTVTLDLSAIVRRPRSRRPRWEILVVARIPQPSGTPTLVEVDALEWETLTQRDTLSRPQALTVRTEISSITEPVRQRLRAPDRAATELWALRGGEQIHAGPLLTGHRQGTGLTLEVGGLMTYLALMFVQQDMRFDQVDQFLIAAALIDQWQTAEFGHFGIDTSSVGTSGRLRDQSYVRDEAHWVDQRLQELGARIDGFDAEIDPTTRKLQLWYPGKGVDRSDGEGAVVFDRWNSDSHDGMFSVAPGDLASLAFGVGSSAGAETSLWATSENRELMASYGRAGVGASWSDISEQATLDDHVGALRDSRDQPVRAPGRRVRVTSDADLTAWSAGDTVQWEVDELLGIGGAYRVRSRQVSVDRAGRETLDVEFV